MFCIKCGAENPDGSKFCLKCGSAMVPIQNNVNSSVAAPPSPPTNNSFSTAPQQPIVPQMPQPPAVNAAQPIVPQMPQPPAVNAQQPIVSNVTVSDYDNPMRIRCPRCKSERIISTTKTTVTTKTSGYKSSLGCLGWLLLGPFGLLCGLCGMGSKTKVKDKDYLICQECGNEFLFADDMLRGLLIQAILCLLFGPLILLGVIINFEFNLGYIGGLLIGLIITAVGVVAVKDYREVKTKGYDASCYKREK